MPRREAGFSLLEMMVAIAILGIALGGLYQATSAATRNVRADERYAYAVELARSLVTEHVRVPMEGVSRAGVTDGGFRWSVAASPADIGRAGLQAGTLQNLVVEVSWGDGTRDRRVQLHTVVEGYNAGGGFL